MAGGEGPMETPHYYVFDLDETLGQMHTPFAFMCTLRPEEFHKEKNPKFHAKLIANANTSELRDRQRVAYMAFVRLLAEAEQQSPPLGVLRPGILEVFRAIQAQRAAGQDVCCVIYSNNGDLHLLELTRDVLHQALGTRDLIRDCVHWFHPMRSPEISPGEPGRAEKTWAVLSRVLKEGPCGAPDVRPSQVTFFDDRVHPDLKTTLGEESIQVLPFSYRVNTSVLTELYRKALEEAGFFSSPAATMQLLEYIKRNCGTVNTKKPLTFENHEQFILKHTGLTAPPEKAPPARLADTDALVAVIKRHDRPVNLGNLGNNPLSAVGSNVFTGGSGSGSGNGKGRLVRRRIVTRRKRSKHVAKKSRHIRRRR
jgi:hypothetical protein